MALGYGGDGSLWGGECLRLEPAAPAPTRPASSGLAQLRAVSRCPAATPGLAGEPRRAPALGL